MHHIQQDKGGAGKSVHSKAAEKISDRDLSYSEKKELCKLSLKTHVVLFSKTHSLFFQKKQRRDVKQPRDRLAHKLYRKIRILSQNYPSRQGAFLPRLACDICNAGKPENHSFIAKV
jgi:hypothetical protein